MSVGKRPPRADAPPLPRAARRILGAGAVPATFVAALFLVSGLAGAIAPPASLTPASSAHSPSALTASPPNAPSAPNFGPRAGGGGGGNNSSYVENGTGFFFNNTAPA